MDKIIQHKIANEIIEYLKIQNFVKNCELHGSLSGNDYDEYSDIDLRIDVSGYDNGKILLMLPYIMGKKFKLSYVAFAPKFASDLYLVSFGLQDTSIFHFVDIECIATPHVPYLQKEEILLINNSVSLFTKLLIGCLKYEIRNKDYSKDIQRFTKYLGIPAEDRPISLLNLCIKKLEKDAHGYVKEILNEAKTILYGKNKENEL